MEVLVRFCFNEINLNKVKLFVFSFNRRAVRCCEKVGFRIEATLRQELSRQGRYRDDHVMGLPRSEWEALVERRTKAGGRSHGARKAREG